MVKSFLWIYYQFRKYIFPFSLIFFYYYLFRSHNNQELKPSRDFKITTEGGRSSLLIAEVFPDDAGVYGVKAVNRAGQASTTATLKVISKQLISK